MAQHPECLCLHRACMLSFRNSWARLEERDCERRPVQGFPGVKLSLGKASRTLAFMERGQ